MARLLVVDDDPDLLLLMRARFGARGHEVAVADSAAGGVTLAAARPPDLLLLDFCLPRMDGARVLQLLRADALTQALPVIVLSAADRSLVASRLPSDPLTRVLEKPFDFDELDALIRELLGAAAFPAA